MTTQACAIHPPQRDAIGVAFVLLSALGVICLPTTAKFAYLDGSNVITVAFARGVIAVVLLMLVAYAMRQSLKLPRALLRPSLIAGFAQVLFVYGVYAAITSINISLALLILYIYPIVLAIHQYRLGRLQIGTAQWFCALLAGGGLMSILGLGIEGTKLIGATRASMLTLVEPPGAALGAWLIFGETYSPLQWCGFFVVLAAIFMFEKLSQSST